MSGKENDRVYDVRVLERNIRKGLVARKDVDRYLKSLPDAAQNVAPPSANDDDDDVDGDEEDSAPGGASGGNHVSGG
jgi:hypothetical protein